ncbi:energy-coupled thiamine transporter ThiT [Spiroplasma endosymbiont of Othius punctulatus]|uniref:energy-coupled thiamine transporter ThiT n=1 Tax=Spiroplasma endosymbiont of Othius punctulatus TaxID=3066289 RepID=UPI0030CEA562
MYIVFLIITVMVWISIMVLNLVQTIVEIKKNILNVGMWVVALSLESFLLLKNKEDFEPDFEIKKNWIDTREIVMTSILLAIFWMFSAINMFIPNLPFGISISIKFIPLFASTIFLRFRYSLWLCLLAGISSLMFAPTIIAFGQWLLEYMLVLMVPCVGALFHVKRSSKLNDLNTTILICTIPWLLIFIFRVLASSIYWFEYAWDGYNIVLFAIIFNLPNTMIDFIVCLVLLPVFLKLKQNIKIK